MSNIDKVIIIIFITLLLGSLTGQTLTIIITSGNIYLINM